MFNQRWKFAALPVIFITSRHCLWLYYRPVDRELARNFLVDPTQRQVGHLWIRSIQITKKSMLKPWLRSWSREESAVFGWSRSRIPNNTWSRSWNRIFFPTPTPDVQLNHFYITLFNWQFLLKWHNFIWNTCWNRDFLLCTTISIDFNSQISFTSH